MSEKKFECRVEDYHKCGCKPKIVMAASLEHADQIAGRCMHGNSYFAHKPSGKGWWGDSQGHRKAALGAQGNSAINKPIRTRREHTSFHHTRKPESDPTYSKEWSGVSHAPEARGKSCPKCGGHLHNEDGNYYCPHCDDYVHPVNQSPYR